MKNPRILPLYVLLSVLLGAGCTSESSKPQSDQNNPASSVALPPSTGARCEVIVVCTEELWNSRAVLPLKNELLRPQPGLPQPEPYFSVMRVDPQNFKNLLQRNKAIIIIEESEKSEFKWLSNTYARPQNIALFTYTRLQDLYELTAQHRRKIFDKFRSQDLISIRTTLEKSGAKWQQATKNYPLRMLMPPGYSRVVHKDNFSMFLAQSAKTHHVIMVYTRPWDPDANLLDEWEIIAIRDSLTTLHTQATRPGSYTIVDTTIKPLSRTFNLNDKLTLEMRGMYKSVNDFLGGPFYNLAIFDDERQLFIIVDAFLQAVGQNKRNMLIEMETIARNIEIK
ncbi:MAG: DUF4837 family protein [Thermaurantimonas sp.]